jgi:hypothetical protein
MTLFLNVLAIVAGLVGAAVLVLYFLGPRD